MTPHPCPLCRGTGWVAWVQDAHSDVRDLVAIASAGPPNLLARPCPECRPSEAREDRESRA